MNRKSDRTIINIDTRKRSNPFQDLLSFQMFAVLLIILHLQLVQWDVSIWVILNQFDYELGFCIILVVESMNRIFDRIIIDVDTPQSSDPFPDLLSFQMFAVKFMILLLQLVQRDVSIWGFLNQLDDEIGFLLRHVTKLLCCWG